MTYKQKMTFTHQVQLLFSLIKSMKITGYDAFPSELDDLFDVATKLDVPDNWASFGTDVPEPFETLTDLHSIDGQGVEIVPNQDAYMTEPNDIPGLLTFTDNDGPERWYCVLIPAAMTMSEYWDAVHTVDEPAPTTTVGCLEFISNELKYILDGIAYWMKNK